MSAQQMRTQPTAMGAQQVSTQLPNMYVAMYNMLSTPRESKEDSTFSYGNIPVSPGDFSAPK